MSSPAERFAAARRRATAERSELARFERRFDFPLDDFQRQACAAVEDGRSVLVAAPTGAGKTIIGEFACHLALSAAGKCFYTTPIKALSNQKYNDLCAIHGFEQVGLLTGDNAINADAPLVVMTTEVLRNMLYAGSAALVGLSHVVLDEVHYLADRARGGVWEEVIIQLPEHVGVIALSATVSNAEEFGDWLQSVRGDTDIVVSERRPVPLWQHILTDETLYDLFFDDDQSVVNPELLDLARRDAHDERLSSKGRQGSGAGRSARRRQRFASRHEPDRLDEIHRLESEGLLPAIVFVFSRSGCDAAVTQVVRAGIRLNDEAERHEVLRIVQERCAGVPGEDLAVLRFAEFEEALARGVAAHHAGMLPVFKEVVEELFTLGLVKVVFATETLALGINMPARSVVLERLVKFNGEHHVAISAGEFTQLTGRAGRRGIDIEGHAVVAWHAGLDPQALGGLASTRTYPLNSSFRPSYNMAVNLLGRTARDRARSLLETSFAQFQADRSVQGLAQEVRRCERSMAEQERGMNCHLGDFTEYSAIRRRLSDIESGAAKAVSHARRAEVAASLRDLEVGDVVALRSRRGRNAVSAVVIDADMAPMSEPRPQVLTADREVRRLVAGDLSAPVARIGTLSVPKGFRWRDAASRRVLSQRLRESIGSHDHTRIALSGGAPAGVDSAISDLRSAMRQHPCHGCADREDHARHAERYWRLHREAEGLRRRIDARSSSIARTFDRVCALLADLEYLEGDSVNASGRVLARLYSESDLLLAQLVTTGALENLDPKELAAVLSALVFESRQREAPREAPKIPAGRTGAALAAMAREWAQIESREREVGLTFAREPDASFAMVAWLWADGRSLDRVLRDSELTPGDFVRTMRQLVDLLGQIAALGIDPISQVAADAVRKCRRGVVSMAEV